MKTRLQFLYITCYNVNYFVSQPVGLDFASGSGFCQWVWIASGPGYENPMGQTPCCIMWSTHNHGIRDYTIQGQSYVITANQQPAFGGNILHTQSNN